ncbi:MAG: S41 family peptidase [Chloroflexota bacterium]
MKTLRQLSILFLTFCVLLSGCGILDAAPTPTPVPLPPPQYLESALQWLQTHAVFEKNVDWAAIRKEAASLAPDPKTPADTYPAICLALRSLKDGNAFLWVPNLEIPNFDSGYETLYPDNKIVTWLKPGGPAEKAGLRVGDVIQQNNGKPPKAYNSDDLDPPCNTQELDTNPQEHLDVLRDGQPLQITIDTTTMKIEDFLRQPNGQRLGAGAHGLGYIELPVDGGHASYPSDVQKLTKELDSEPVCGWILDVRRNAGGDIWSYMAAVGPILGEGDLGGFVYLDGTREPWAYRKGRVLWNGEDRYESDIDGSIYTPKRVTPVALLIGPGTQAAGELLVVAFQGRADVRTFGAATRGLPTLHNHTDLSDGTSVYVSGAFSFDRKGVTYDGPIAPDVPAETGWSKFGTQQDPAVQAAASWLSAQRACQP